MMRRLREALRGVYLRLKNRLTRPYATRIVREALPKKLKRKTLYVVEDDGFEEQAAMLCPCGCGAVLHLNLLTDERPCWRVTRHGDGTATLQPSVWRGKGCMSHFWFRRGRIEWCDGIER
jgi:Family of unknown function (DUF6527)